MIERYYHSEEGYNPFLIRNGWQVAQLNYLPGHGLNDIDMVEAHNHTDEVFVLFEGTAVLISAEIKGDDVGFDMIKMEQGVTYNIPAGMWHNIAMDPKAKMIIVENDNTHLNDCVHHPLTEKQMVELYAAIKSVL